MPKYVFELKARAVSTVVAGVPIDLDEKNPTYSTSDEGEAAALRQIDGLKEVTKKETN